MIKMENQQLKDLNRKLVDELQIYRNKDTLKEAEYIINHEYNETLIPQKYKYLFEHKQKYLQAIHFKEKYDSMKVKTEVKNDF